MSETDIDLPLPEVSALVRSLVRQQASIVLERWADARPLAFKNRRDFVTTVDLEVEQALKQAIGQHFPDHGLAGEETDAIDPSAPYQWLIDPIDGTKYYTGQSHLFSISIGLVHHGVPVLGVVHVPTSGQVFHAYTGGGAFLDGTRLEGSSAGSLQEALVNIDIPKSDCLPPDERGWFEDRLMQLTRRVYRVRALGAGALSACWLASGALDGFIDLTGYNKPQDVAAGRVIMSESGMRVEHLQPPAGPPRLVAAPPALWNELQALLMGSRKP